MFEEIKNEIIVFYENRKKRRNPDQCTKINVQKENEDKRKFTS